MVGVRHGSGCGQAQTWMLPPTASLVLFQHFVRVSDGQTAQDVDFKTTTTKSVLSQAMREASAEGTVRVPTNFPADQIRLWVAYTRCPCVFRTQSSLLNIFATLEVADMMADEKAISELCLQLAKDYLSILRTEAPPTPTEITNFGTETEHRSDKPKRRRCRAPQPRLGCRHAFLWGASPAFVESMKAVTPRTRQHCCQAAKAKLEARPQPSAVASTEVIGTALRLLPEHLLLRVLRAWGAPLAVQLGALPRRLLPAALTAALPSIDRERSLTVPHLSPACFRRAIRAVAELASLRCVHSVTLNPPTPRSKTATDLHFAVRHLGRTSSITSLSFTDVPKAWLGTHRLRGLACITVMPHLCAVSVEHVHLRKLPGLLESLAPMTHLRELQLQLESVPLMHDGSCSAAACVEQVCSALTMLTALRLKLQYKPTCLEDESSRVFVTARLRQLRNARVSVGSETEFEGRLPMDSVLGELRAAAPQLDMAQSWVDVCGEVWLGGLDDAQLEAIWAALRGEGARDRVMEELCVGWAGDGVRSYDDHGVAIAPALLVTVPRLLGLSMLHKSMLDRSSAAALARNLHVLTALTSLCLAETALGAFEAKILLPRLCVLTTLQSLDLSGNCMGPEGGVALAAGLRPLCALAQLHLGANDLGAAGAAAVLDALHPTARAQLRDLDLERNMLGPEGMMAVAVRLRGMYALESLNLDANVSGPEGAAALADALLLFGAALSTLSLSRNFLECAGAVSFARCLTRLTSLESLDLSANAIGVVGARAIARRLRSLPSIKEFDMEHNCIGDTGAKAIARGLGRAELSGELRLLLNGNEIGDAGAIALADTMHAKRMRAVVNLKENYISKRVWYLIGARILPDMSLCVGRPCSDDGSWHQEYMAV